MIPIQYAIQHGLYYIGVTSTMGTGLPGPKTEVTLKEITLSQDSSGFPTLSAPVTVQTLHGSLQAAKPKEKEEWEKVGIRADYVFYVSPNQFIDDTNEAKLVEKNIITYSGYTYEIVGVEPHLEMTRGAHYKVILQVLK